MAFTGCGRSTRSINFLSYKRTLQYNGLYIPCMYFTRVTLITLTVCCSSAPVCSIVSTSRSFRNTCSSHTLTGRSLTAHHKHNIIAYLINIIIILLYCVAAVLVSCEGYTRGGFVPFVAIRSPVTRQNTLAFF